VHIFLSCAAASCSEDPSIGLRYTLHNDDLPKRIRHHYQVRLQFTANTQHISRHSVDLGGIPILGNTQMLSCRPKTRC
jgi:hypothetical protein